MTKSLMISIQPQHAVNILNGKKTLELRTWIPKDYVGWVYVYVTKGKPYLIKITSTQWLKDNIISYTLSNKTLFFEDVLNGKVVARFWFDEYEKLLYVKDRSYERSYELSYKQQRKLCLTDEQIHIYGKGKDLYAWHIKKLEIFDEPKELSDFIVGLNYLGDIIPPTYKRLKRPPQRSVWVYTKEN